MNPSVDSKTRAIGSTPDTLAAIARRFDDLPIEALVKEDLLRQGVSFDRVALERTQGKKAKSYFIFSFDRVSIDAMENGENLRVPEEIALEGGPLELRRTIVSVRINPESPYVVVPPADTADASFDATLTLAGSPLAHIRFPEAPAYYSRTLSGGRPLTEVAPCIEWGYLLYLTTFRRCQYFGRDEECRFCDINENYRQQKDSGRPYVAVKDVEEIIEALSIIADTDHDSHAYTITGGAVTSELRGETEGAFYVKYARAIEERWPGRWIGKMVTQALPRDQVQAYRDAGVSIYHPNYEVWDASLFENLCPGKARTIGHREWVQRIEDAAEVFGPHRVIPNFVGGVEMSKPYGFDSIEAALASTGAGLRHFMSQGIVPRFTTWCVEPLSDLGRVAGQDAAPLEYHAGLLRLWRDTHAEYGLPSPPGYGPPGVGRAVFSVSAFMDVIDPETPIAEL